MDHIRDQVIQQWQLASEQVKSNTRLRISLWVIIGILLAYPLLALSDYNQSIRSDIVRELEREAKILRTASEKQWLERAENVAAFSTELQGLFWEAPSVGIAKATLHQSLTDWAQNHDLQRVQIRLEEPLAVESMNNVFRVAGQIDATFDANNSMAFIKDLELNGQRVVVEQMEISQRVRPVHKLVIAAYFRIDND
ncbi:hypothetical protein PN836_012710 [Ningiella sp. W23]|uniref:hypothetical protein n=1 Tax=Ningiella sp. W23 TaxID=3023715 RepID=UPI003757AB79